MENFSTDFVASFIANLPGTCYRCEVNADWTMRYISEHIEILSGFPASDFIDDQVRTYDSIIHPEDRELVANTVADGVSNNQPYTIQYRIQTQRGEVKWVLERGRPTIAENGDRMLDGFIIDITERMELEEARRSAEAASEAKSQFLARISHEIRTPLNGIVGMTSLLRQQDDLSESSTHLVDTIWSSSEILRHLINDVLDFSKIEAGKFETHQGPFRLQEAVSMVIETMKPLALEKGITLACQMEADLPETLLGDALRVKQVLLNLISNAIKFTQHGEVNLRLSRRDNFLQFAVQDSGIGIPEKMQQEIFSPFFQLKSVEVNNQGGTGLGLAIARHLATLMGGQLTLDSSLPLQGSTFTLSLPIHEPSRSQMAVKQTKQETSPRDEHYDLNILVVDDIATNQEVAKAMLARLNSQSVKSADNGREAVAFFNQDPSIDVILMDMQMPEMDGIEATKAIRTHPQGKKPFIVAMTGNVMEDQRERRSRAGLNSFLGKPFTLSELQATLDEALVSRS